MTECFSCPMCGCTFDPTAHAGCQSCPLNRDCTLICCPECGYQTVDTGRSSLARIAAGFLSKINSLARDPAKVQEDRS